MAVDEGLAIQRGVDSKAVRPELLVELLTTMEQGTAALAREQMDH